MYGGVEFCDYPNPLNANRIDTLALPMVHDMHRFGIRLDVPLLNSMSAELGEKLTLLEAAAQETIGNAYQDTNGKGVRTPFMITSPDHVSRLLFEHLKVQGDDPVPMTEKGARFATSDDILQLFSKRHPVIPNILEHRSLSKVKGTYADPLPLLVDDLDRLHTSFNVTIAATGRLTSSNPNLQNIPIRTEIGKRIRQAFIAEYGCVLVSCDLSQIEMVWAAHRSQDPTMMEVFHKGQDLHSRTACIVFDRDYDYIMGLSAKVDNETATPEEVKEWKYFKSFQRLPCKTTGFGVLYGQTAEGLQASLMSEGIDWALDLCEDFIVNKFFGVYKMLKVMLDRDYSRAMRYGLIWDDFGRVRLVPEAKSALKWIANEGTRKAGNHPEQSSAQGTIKLAMAALTPIYRALNGRNGLVVRPLLQIHDQLIWEVSSWFAQEWAATVKYEMENATRLLIPVRASSDIGGSWAEL